MKSKLLYTVILVIGCSITAFSNDVARISETSVTPKHWSGLPIWGEQAAERGFKLPSPFGVTLLYNDQTVPYRSHNDFNIVAHGGLIGGPEGENVSIPKDDVKITGRDQSVQLRADMWLYPFLNLFGIVGYTDGNKDVKANTKNISIPGRPVLEEALRRAGSLRIPIDYDALNIGLGFVLAGQVDPFGWHPFIMTLVGTHTVARTTTTHDNIYTTIGAFKLGQRHSVSDGKLSALLGVTYQYIDQQVAGNYDFRGTNFESFMESVDYEVDIVSDEMFNLAATLMYDFGENEDWNVMIEYGFLNWDQLTFALGRRF